MKSVFKYYISKKTVRTMYIAAAFSFLSVTYSQISLAESANSIVEEYSQTLLNDGNKSDRKRELTTLLDRAIAYDREQGTAESQYLIGRIHFGLASTQGFLGGRKSLAKARDSIELALSQDSSLREGAPKALLGYLYAGLPGWPLSFGDRERGFGLLDEAMEINGENLANNFFYAFKYILSEDYPSARDQLIHARSLTSPNSDTPLLESLLLREIEETLQEVEEKLVSQ